MAKTIPSSQHSLFSVPGAILLCLVLIALGALAAPAWGGPREAPQDPEREREPGREPLVEPEALSEGSLADAGEVEADLSAEPPVLVGEVSRDEVESAVPTWVQAEIEASLDPAAVQDLSMVEPGAEVTVFLGTWCSDSKRELSRLWRAFDEMAGLVPFEVTYIAVGRDKEQPEARIEGSGLEYVPTFIVRRGGEEVGRIVEEAPHGIVEDLEALLSGEAEGVVSAREDLAGDGEAEGEGA